MTFFFFFISSHHKFLSNKICRCKVQKFSGMLHVRFRLDSRHRGEAVREGRGLVGQAVQPSVVTLQRRSGLKKMSCF